MAPMTMGYTSMRYSSMRDTSIKSRCSIEHYYILYALHIYGSILLLVLEECPKNSKIWRYTSISSIGIAQNFFSLALYSYMSLVKVWRKNLKFFVILRPYPL
jgi:hypothetical protein